jgi:hypothetical protein
MKHFRKPAMYVQLPSEGKWYPAGTFNTGFTGEVAVYAMTAIDELVLSTPDALLNGSAISELITSCVPDIKDAFAPIVDIDKLLVAVRIASYGQNMNMSATCPKCLVENSYSIDVSNTLSSFKSVDYSKPVKFADTGFAFVKPMSYKIATNINNLRFENEKLLLSVKNDPSSNPEMQKKIVETLKQIKTVAIAASVDKIQIDNDEVTDYNFILEYLKNTSRRSFNAIADGVNKLVSDNRNEQSFDIICGEKECGHKFKAKFEFDASSFFDVGS